MSTTLRLRRLVVSLAAAAALAISSGGAPPLLTSAMSTPAPSGTPLAAACPGTELPAAGALSITTGAVEWFACAPDETYRTVIGASDTTVLIDERGPVGQRTIAFDTADGSERWHRATPSGPFPSPIPQGPIDGEGIVVLAVADQDAPALVGVDAVTGDEQWRVASSHVPLAHSTTVAVVGDATSPGASSRFRGIDRVTGEELWVSFTPLVDMSGVFVARSPVAVLGEVVVVPTGATVTAIDMRTGATLWQAPQLDHPAAADGVIVGTRGANSPAPEVAALDASSGQLLWTASGRPSYGDLLAAGDGVIAVLDPNGSGIVAYALASGDERWRVTQSSYGGEPQLIDGTSLVLLWEGVVSVLSTTDGATIWSATEQFQSPLMNSAGSNGETDFVAINSLPWGD